MSIINQCMIVNISIGMWSGYRTDKAVSQKVANDHGAETSAGRYNKHLIPKDMLDPLVSKGSALRAYVRSQTLPWRDNGDRLLPRQNYHAFMEGFRKLKEEFDAAARHFLDVDYPRAKDQAAFRMGTMFNPSDYPSASEIRHRFYVSLDIEQVTDPNDIRVKLEQSELDQIRATMEQNLEARINRAVGDVWERVATTVETFARQMREGKRFHASLLENMQEIVDLLPALNVLNDPKLAEAGEDIRKTLLGYDIKELRKDKELRAEAASDADEVMARMAGFMKAA